MTPSSGPGGAPTPPSSERTMGLVRSLNMQAVLEAIVEAGELSRPAAAAITGLSLPTAASLIADLETLGLVGSKGQSVGAPGRPATLYSFNGRAGYVFAVDLGARKVTACVSDLHGSILLERTEGTKRTNSEDIVQQIVDLHKDLTDKSGFSADDPGVASIGIGGIVRPRQGVVTEVTNLPELEGSRFLAKASESLHIPVILENDVNLAAIGERWKGQAGGLNDFVVMSVGSGTGMGIVIDGALYRGSNGAAGEIARLPIGGDPDDPISRDRGAFEAATSGAGISLRHDATLAAGSTTKLPKHADVAEIFEAASAGDTAAQAIVDAEADTLALGVVAVVSLLDPEMVVFTGGIGSQELLVAAIRSRVAELLPSPPPIVVSQLGSRGSMYGALAIALQSVRTQILLGSSDSR